MRIDVNLNFKSDLLDHLYVIRVLESIDYYWFGISLCAIRIM